MAYLITQSKKKAMILVCLAVGLVLLLGTVRPALAHSRVEVGPYVLVLGWQAEPPIVGERNALTLEVIDQDGSPVGGVDSTLDIEVQYADRSFRSNLVASATPGVYTAEIFPTVRGQYAVHIFGDIEEEPVDVMLEPEEVFAASRIQFPEPVPDVRDLETQLMALQGELQSARLVAYAGLALGLIGVGLAAVGLRRSAQQN